ncbi:MAG: MFS transporter [Planctomycetes bacterium]|nr:MFS transporter [Planctomycetota bacterium]
MQRNLQIHLSAFMFLQYFIWGSWYVSMGSYMFKALGFSGTEIGAAYGAFAIGAMISPFFVGLIADRYFSSEKLLGVFGLVGAAVLCLLPQMKTFGSFYPTLILYCALYVPTLALGNSLSLHHLRDAKTAFPRIKIFSSVGWIAGGIAVSLVHVEETAGQFYLAGGLSLVFGLFSFTLPHTPPRKVGANVSVREILGLDALALLKKPAFAIYVGCMFLICIPLYFYFVGMHVYLNEELKWSDATAKMTLAQVSDVVFLFLLPFMLKSLGYKKTIAVGILAWITRYFLLAQSANSTSMQTVLIFGAILLHGVCYDFLFIAGQLYVDSESNERIRGAAQGFFAFILWGVGGFVGTLLAGMVIDAYKLAEPVGAIQHDWQAIWMVPALGATAVLIVFFIFFREPKPR